MFDVKVKPADFLGALDKVGKTVSRGRDGQYAYSKCLYMESYDDNGSLKLKITTSNVSDTSEIIIDLISASDLGVCETLVEFDKFYDILQTVKGKNEFHFENVDENELNVRYTGRTKPIVINGLPYTKFILPSRDAVDFSSDIDTKAFKDSLDKISSIIHEQAALKQFNNVKLDFKNTELIISAWDMNFSIPVMYKIIEPYNFESSIHVECIKLRRLLTSFDVSKKSFIEITQNNVVLSQGNLRVAVRLNNNLLPDLVTPFSIQSKIDFEVDRNEFVDALKRIEILSEGELKTRSCRVIFFEDHVELDLNSKLGSNEEIVTSNMVRNVYPQEKNHIPFKVDYNIKALKSAVESINAPTIQASFATSAQVVLSEAGANQDLYKLMVPKMTVSKADTTKTIPKEDPKPKEEVNEDAQVVTPENNNE